MINDDGTEDGDSRYVSALWAKGGDPGGKLTCLPGESGTESVLPAVCSQNSLATNRSRSPYARSISTGIVGEEEAQGDVGRGSGGGGVDVPLVWEDDRASILDSCGGAAEEVG